MHRNKKITWITLAFAAVVLGCLAFYASYLLSRPFLFDERGSIPLGSLKAKVELVVFEDFQCSHCQIFSEQILPEIETRYIDTGMVRCFLVPLPLFPGSRALTNAALTIFHETPDRLFPFLKEAAQRFRHEKVTQRALLETAEAVGGIDLHALEDCIEKRCYYADIDKNLKAAKKIMKKNVLVPTLYIDGEIASVESFEEISAHIQKELQDHSK